MSYLYIKINFLINYEVFILSYLKLFIRWLLIFFCIGSSFYVGVWLLLVGGVVQLVGEIETENISRISVFISLLKLFFAKPIGLVMLTPCMYLNENLCVRVLKIIAVLSSVWPDTLNHIKTISI